MLLLVFRFVILKLVRKDRITQLPLPRRIIDYLSTQHYYSEQLMEWEEQDSPVENSVTENGAWGYFNSLLHNKDVKVYLLTLGWYYNIQSFRKYSRQFFNTLKTMSNCNCQAYRYKLFPKFHLARCLKICPLIYI